MGSQIQAFCRRGVKVYKGMSHVTFAIHNPKSALISRSLRNPFSRLLKGPDARRRADAGYPPQVGPGVLEYVAASGKALQRRSWVFSAACYTPASCCPAAPAAHDEHHDITRKRWMSR